MRSSRHTKETSGNGVACLAAACLAVAIFTGCEKSGEARPNRPSGDAQAVPVTVAMAERRDVPVRVRAIGYVEAMASVAVRPQVDGRIEQAHFAEGGVVKEGDLLYTIDARPFEVALQMAQANLERSKAVASHAKREADRIQRLFDQQQASDREQDLAATAARSSEADLEARTAELRMAELNLEYCTIRSPMNGRAGSRLVHPGTIVEKNKTDLVVVNQLSPIRVLFSLPEQYLSRARTAAERQHETTIQLTGDSESQTGRLTFVDNEVDRTTGMIRLMATFDNANGRLWPGAYGSVELTVENLAEVVVVPATAIQQGLAEPFVFVVQSDKTVDVQSVKPSMTIEGETVLESGLAGGETIVVDGQLRLTDKAPVSIRESAATTQPAVLSSKGAP